MFFPKSLQKQKIRLEYKLNQNNINSKIQFSNLSELELKILKYFGENESGTVLKITRHTQSNRNTVKKALSMPVDKKYLILHSKGRGAWYSKGDDNA